MADAKYYPDEWKAFCRLVKKGVTPASPGLSRFAARYRSAGNFHSAYFFGLSDELCAGYSAIIKLMLCYSALEILCKAIGHDVSRQQVVDARCAGALRAVYGTAASYTFPLTTALTNKKLLSRLDACLRGTSDDVLPLAAALRHLFAHGFWTPTGGEAVSRRATEALEALALALLWQCDQVFAAHVQGVSGARADDRRAAAAESVGA